jgi:hypothetical protein
MKDGMSDQDLERRLTSWMASAAPRPAPGLTDRVLRATATTPQRRRWSFGLAAMTALGAVAAVAVAVVIGLQAGRIAPDAGPGTGTGPSAPAVPSPTESAPESAGQSPSASVPAVRDFYRCENAADGYALEVPADWYANPRVEAGEGLDDVPACRFFGPTEFEIVPNSGVPAGVAISIQVAPQPPPAAGTVVQSGEVTVAGRPAVVREVETTSEGLTPPGTLVYEYVISLADGRVLHASTASQDEAQWADRRDVLDAMMETLEITG